MEDLNKITDKKALRKAARKAYRKAYPIWIIFLIIVILLSGRSRSIPPMGKYYSMRKVCPQYVDGIKDLHAKLTTPDLYTYGEEIDYKEVADQFDVNDYFEILDDLSVEEGFYFSHLYFGDLVGGKPMLYVVPSGDGPFYLYDEYRDYLEKEAQFEATFMSLSLSNEYLSHIVVEDSPEGYFQYMLLDALGDQFQLSWHALYNDRIFLCGSSSMKNVWSEMASFQVLPFGFFKPLRAYTKNLTPYVIMREDTAIVSFVTFSKWGGFVESTITYDREFPHEVIDYSRKTLINYNCGVAF